MTDKFSDGGPAFPYVVPDVPIEAIRSGMTLREYAAIHLQQPDSGIDWLDDMIRNAKRDALAGRAISGVKVALPAAAAREVARMTAEAAYILADAMLSTGEAQQ